MEGESVAVVPGGAIVVVVDREEIGAFEAVVSVVSIATWLISA